MDSATNAKRPSAFWLAARVGGFSVGLRFDLGTARNRAENQGSQQKVKAAERGLNSQFSVEASNKATAAGDAERALRGRLWVTSDGPSSRTHSSTGPAVGRGIGTGVRRTRVRRPGHASEALEDL